uniref:AAA-ATPase-like domain-containing protein n=1 Tax=Ditylenchus dipsaci TaxID=166011 RepID=A0A915E270_9BILA
MEKTKHHKIKGKIKELESRCTQHQGGRLLNKTRRNVSPTKVSSGTVNFEEQADSSAFVDKSNMIKTFMRIKEKAILNIAESLVLLSDTLFKFFHKKVIVLIDESDGPFHTAMKNNVDLDQVYDFLNSILQCLVKADTKVLKSYLTGTTGMIAGANSCLNNITTYRFQEEHRFCNYFGYTQSEVDILLHNFKVPHPGIISRFYGGYSNGTIYNSYSVTKFLAKGNWKSRNTFGAKVALSTTSPLSSN